VMRASAVEWGVRDMVVSFKGGQRQFF